MLGGAVDERRRFFLGASSRLVERLGRATLGLAVVVSVVRFVTSSTDAVVALVRVRPLNVGLGRVRRLTVDVSSETADASVVDRKLKRFRAANNIKFFLNPSTDKLKSTNF